MSKIGISKFHYAVQSAEENATTDATYSTTTAIPGLVSIEVNTDSTTNTLYADNGPYETSTTMGSINVTIDLADLPLQDQAALLGHTYDSSAKTLVKKTSDVAPNTAILFEFLMGNGKTLACKLYKGKFAEVPMSGQTKGENIEFQTNQITASFAALKGKANNAGKWMYCQEFEANASTDAFYSAPIVSADPNS